VNLVASSDNGWATLHMHPDHVDEIGVRCKQLPAGIHVMTAANISYWSHRAQRQYDGIQ
jgi:hypothetical protein